MNRALLACIAVALLLRLIFVFIGFPFIEKRWHLRDDGDGYRQLAETILLSRYDDVTRGPVYPLLVAACPGMSLKVVQSIFDTAVCGLVFWLSGRRIWAAWLWAVYPFAIWRVAFVNKETVLTFLLIVYFCIQVRAWRLDCWRDWMLAGVMLGLVNLCKPMFLLWPVAVIGICCWSRSVSFGRGLRLSYRVGALVLGMVVVIAPWTYRNWRVTGGEFLPVATERGGVTTFIGNYQPTLGLWEGPGKPRWQSAVAEIESQNAGKSVVQMDRLFYRAAWQEVAGNPRMAVELAIRKCWRFWFLGAARREQFLSFVIQAGYMALLCIGLMRARSWSGGTGWLLGVIGYVMLLHALSYADLRFSVIVMPYVCALAAGASKDS
ncbi:MAG: hypothetical protein WCS70_11280 [Verrucomicrobiota bacterium]